MADKLLTQGDQLLELIRTEYPGYHPILAIARLAHTPAVLAEPRLELDCHKTIATHTVPRLTSVEAKVEVSETRRVIVSLFEAEGTTPIEGEVTRLSELDLQRLVAKELEHAS